MTDSKNKTFIYNNGLIIAFLLLAVLAVGGQTVTGWNQYNEFLTEHKKEQATLFAYLSTGHFLQATFENWESEFFQMALFVWFTVFLRQKGSSESKQLTGKEEVDRQPKKHPDAPWPVRKGGWILKLYKHSLSLSLMILFFISFPPLIIMEK